MATILCLNSGSSSLKFALFEGRTPGDEELPEPLLSGVLEATRDGPRCTLTTAEGTSETRRPDITAGKVDEEVRWLLGLLRERKETTTPPAVVAHRIVHGGTRYTEAVVVTSEILSDLDALTPFAPLHQPPGLQGIRTATALLPEALQVACFDTAFHAGHPEVEARYPLPRVWYERGYRRYGFHGLSYASVARRLPRLLGGRVEGSWSPISEAGRACADFATSGVSRPPWVSPLSTGS